MAQPVRRALVACVILAVALPAAASFHASDLIYLYSVAHNAGFENALWRTDVFITNVDTVPIDVIMVYLPSGLTSNAALFTDRSSWLGGREDEGVGFVNPALADIPPNGTVVLTDVVGEYWEGQLGFEGLGAMIVFAHEAGSLEPDGTRVFRNAVVHARVYNETTIWEPDPDNEGEFVETEATYGQIVPGVPWYDLADPGAVSDERDFSFLVLAGGVGNENFRYNVGVVNASDPLTTITVRVQPLKPNGEPYLDDQGVELRNTVTMPPLTHVQFNGILPTLGIEETGHVMIKVSHIGWSSFSADPTPAMTAYGSFIDNRSNDATTIVPSFVVPFDVECMFGGVAAAKDGGSSGRVTRRPVSVSPLPGR